MNLSLLALSVGQFDEKVFAGLDFVIAEAGKRGLKLILALTNYWAPFGGMLQYVRYAMRACLDRPLCCPLAITDQSCRHFANTAMLKLPQLMCCTVVTPCKSDIAAAYELQCIASHMHGVIQAQVRWLLGR